MAGWWHVRRTASSRSIRRVRVIRSTPASSIRGCNASPSNKRLRSAPRVARCPVIDMHPHLGWSKTGEKGVPLSEEMTFFAPAETLIPVMDRKNVAIMVNLTGGHGRGVTESVAQFERKYPGRFMTFTELSY